MAAEQSQSVNTHITLTATSVSDTTAGRDTTTVSCADRLLQLFRQVYSEALSKSPSPEPQSSNRPQNKRPRIITLDEAVATGKRIRLSQPKPPQPQLKLPSPSPSVSRYVSGPVAHSIEQPQYAYTRSPSRRRSSGKPPGAYASVINSLEPRSWPNSTTPNRARCIEALSHGIRLRPSSPLPGFRLTEQETHQAGLEKWQRKRVEAYLQEGHCVKLIKERDEDRQNRFMRKRGDEKIWAVFSHRDDPELFSKRRGRGPREKFVWLMVRDGEGMRKTRCGRVVKMSARARK